MGENLTTDTRCGQGTLVGLIPHVRTIDYIQQVYGLPGLTDLVVKYLHPNQDTESMALDTWRVLQYPAQLYGAFDIPIKSNLGDREIWTHHQVRCTEDHKFKNKGVWAD